MNLKLRGRDERHNIEAFDSDTKRMEAEIKALKELVLTPAQRAAFDHQLELMGHQHIYDTIAQVNEAELAPSATNGSGQ